MTNAPERRVFRHRIDELPEWQRAPVEIAALELLRIGAYNGSETDAVTDALAILTAVLPRWAAGT